MIVTISDEDPRSIKAFEIAARASQWLKCRGRDGQELYGIPSCTGSGRYYLVTTASCDCQDARRHPGQPCKHVLAVRLHVALAKGSQKQPRRSAFVAVHTNADGTKVYLPRPDAEPDEKFWRRFED